MTARARRWPASAWLLSALAAMALLAPCLAGARPILRHTSEGFQMPAVRGLLRPLPAAAPDPGGGAAAAGEGWALGPPIGHDPLAIDLASRLEPPGSAHWLGTDELGRDILSRLIHAARPSLLVAALATLVSLGFGIPIGAAAGYGGRWTDLILSRLIEASLSFPALVLLLLLSSLTLRTTGGAAGGAESLLSVVVVGAAVGLARWGVIARYMRAEVLRLRRTDLEAAARAAGSSPLRVVARHLVPAGLSPVIVSAAFGAGTAVVAEASLSFLGMGVQPPAPTWGQMIASAWQHGGGAWWMLVFPGAMVALTVGAFNGLGESLRRGGPGSD